jgi:hypothetical protein
MYRITAEYSFNEILTTEIDFAQDKIELEIKYNEFIKKWYYKICPHLSPVSGLLAYHLILRKINEMNNKDGGNRKFIINIDVV